MGYMTEETAIQEEEITIHNRRDYSKLYNLLNKDVKHVEIKILYNIEFAEPFDILVITQFIILCNIRDCKVHFIIRNPDILKYFNDIGLSNFCNKNYIQPRTIISIPSRTAMPIRRVRLENIDEYINSTHNYLNSICEGKELTMLNSCLAELINNVYDHSKSEIDAYVFCQYYHKTRRIKIAVADFGIGIPFSVNQYLKATENKVLTEFEAIEWALKYKNTVKSSPRNRGHGLSTINEFIKGNSGVLILRSNNVKLFGIDQKNSLSVNDIKEFNGTCIEITINVDNLDIKMDIDWDWTDF